MVKIKVETPDSEEVQRWLIKTVNPEPSIRPIANRIGLETEGIMKEMVQTSTKTGGQTAASIRWWDVDTSKDLITIAVGSRIRGHILRWLDKGRGIIIPKYRGALRFWIKGQKIFSMRSKRAPAKDIFFKRLEKLHSRIEKIVNEVKK